MEIVKTWARILFADRAEEHLIDTIEHGGQWWLVAEWLQENATGERIPLRLIRPVRMVFEEARAGLPYRFVLERLIPKAVLDGERLPEFEVVDRPALDDTRGSTSIH